MTRFAHISDLHFGEAEPARIAALADDIKAQAPAAIAVSGDLTRRATATEFLAAMAFLNALGAPILVVPGNHDIPRFDLFQRFLSPRQRWLAARPAGLDDVLNLPGLRLIGLDSVSRAQWHLDWAAGAVSEQRRARLEAALSQPSEDATVVVCHHPLRHPGWARARHAPRHAEATVALLRTHGVAGVLCGHLHRAGAMQLGEGGPLQVVAPSALSPRGTGHPNGWNLITVEAGRVSVMLREWGDEQWTAREMQADTSG